MTDTPNGFTGFNNHDENFESAAEASRKLQEAIASGAFAARTPSSAPAPTNVLQGVFGATKPGDGPKDEASGASGSKSTDKADGKAAEGAPAKTMRKATERVVGKAAGSFMPLAEDPDFDFDALDGITDVDKRWAWAEIDLSAIRHNVAITRRYLDSRTRLMAVVKADAYGHGAVQASKAMLGAGADRLAVSSVPEAVDLRKAGITAPIVILEQPPFTSVPLLLAYHITPAIYDPDFAVAYGEKADRYGVMAPYHLAVNTGLNRIGVPFRDAEEFLQQVSFHRALELEGVFTHFATADVPETLDFQVQARRFWETLETINAAGFNPGIVHAANSAATFRFPDVHFDMVRCGLSLYGVHPCEATRDRVDLRPAMSVHARIIDTNIVPVSEGVSFGYHYRSPGSVKICTLPIGYADGLQRSLSGNMDVIMEGRYYRQVGAICMDHCMFEIDLRNRRNPAYDAQVGDHVTIVGEEGAAQITMDELAEKVGTVPYEILTNFGQRMARVYR